MTAFEYAKAASGTDEERQLAKLTALDSHIRRALADFNGVNGLVVSDYSLYKQERMVALVAIIWVGEEYLLDWTVKHPTPGNKTIGRSYTTEEFDKCFGEAMARYL